MELREARAKYSTACEEQDQAVMELRAADDAQQDARTKVWDAASTPPRFVDGWSIQTVYGWESPPPTPVPSPEQRTKHRTKRRRQDSR